MFTSCLSCKRIFR